MRKCVDCVYNLDEVCILPKNEECIIESRPLGAQSCYGKYYNDKCYRCAFKMQCLKEMDKKMEKKIQEYKQERVEILK